MRLSAKLCLTLASLFLCVILISITSLCLLDRLNRSASEAVRRRVEIVMVLNRIRMLSETLRSYEQVHVASVVPSAKNMYDAQILQVEKRIETAIAAYRDLVSPGGEADAAELEKAWAECRNIHDRLLFFSRQFSFYAVQNRAQEQSSASYRAFGALLERLHHSVGERFSEDVRYIDIVRFTGITILTVLVAFAVLGWIMLRGMFLTLGTDPAELGALARRVADGDLDFPKRNKAKGVYADLLVMVEKLRTYIRSLEALTANIPGGVRRTLLDEQYTLHSYSDGFLDLFGYAREELPASMRSFLPQEVWEGVDAAVKAQLERGNTYGVEYPALHRDGHTLWISDHGRLVCDEMGRPFLYSVLMDVTELRRAREKNRIRGDQFRTALCSINDMVFEAGMEEGTFGVLKGGDLRFIIYDEFPVNYPDAFQRALNRCHPDDADGFRAAFTPELLLRGDGAAVPSVSLEYRLLNWQGAYLWFSTTVVPFASTDETPDRLFGCIRDITGLKTAEESIKTQGELFRAALCATNAFVFESSMEPDSFVLLNKHEEWLEMLGRFPRDYPDAYVQTFRRCHADDRRALRTIKPSAALKKAREGVKALTLEYRIRAEQDRLVWFRATIVPFRGSDGKPDKFLACLMDVTKSRVEEGKILRSARYDSLTGLCNKAYTEELITELFAESAHGERHALMIVDVDNFKAVNDNLGHLFGDVVLADVASAIGKLVRSSDIVGRIGGDEFLVCLRDIGESAVAERKAAEICAALRRTFSSENKEYAISGSVGVTLFPQDGDSYTELLKRADTALYVVKKRGKGDYRFYSRGEGAAEQAPLTDFAPVRPSTPALKNGLLAHIFELLYEARDLGTVIELSLGMIGKRYGVSRVFFLWKPGPDSRCDCAYEWLEEGTPCVEPRVQELSPAVHAAYRALYDAEGVLRCEDASGLDEPLRTFCKVSGIRAFLYRGIFDEERALGFVGLDCCAGPRRWNAEERETLVGFAKILSVFLLKKDRERKPEPQPDGQAAEPSSPPQGTAGSAP